MRKRKFEKITLGKITIFGINDFEEENDLRQFFPELKEEEIGAYKKTYPQMFSGDLIDPFTYFCYLIRTENENILVDAGVGGGPGCGIEFVSDWKGKLLDRLTELGVKSEDIDKVIITHIHPDHIGWCVLPDGNGGYKKTFPNAEYIANKADYDGYYAGVTKAPFCEGFFEACIETVKTAGALVLVEEDNTPVAENISLYNVPGHTPGSMCVLIKGKEKICVLAGDAFGGVMQITDPAQKYCWDIDSEAAYESRQKILSMAPEDGRFYIGACHFGIGSILTFGGKNIWNEVEWTEA